MEVKDPVQFPQLIKRGVLVANLVKHVFLKQVTEIAQRMIVTVAHRPIRSLIPLTSRL